MTQHGNDSPSSEYSLLGRGILMLTVGCQGLAWIGFYLHSGADVPFFDAWPGNLFSSPSSKQVIGLVLPLLGLILPLTCLKTGMTWISHWYRKAFSNAS